VVTTDADDEMSNYLAHNEVRVERVVRAARGQFKIPGTPMLFVLDAAGTVQKVWSGRLSPAEEDAVLAAVGATQ
jgi:hypothetical protein